jgi:single-strand DNA-binding protein
MSINIVTISGNLTRDPELRQAGNTYVLSFGVAVNDRRRNSQSGQWESVPNFVDCIIFGTRADALAGLLHKGSKVAIDGKLRYSSWEGKDGKKRSKLEVVVGEIELMQQRETSQQPQPQRYQQPQGYQQRYQQPDAVPFD